MVWNSPMNDAHSRNDLIRSFYTQFGREPKALAHAHGRANLIGEHTDYNDGLVLPCLISNRTEVALAIRDDDLICGISNQFLTYSYDANTRQILGYQDFRKNLQKTLLGSFSDAARKPSKNHPAALENVENPSKNLPGTVF